jgi:hypothetical protein
MASLATMADRILSGPLSAAQRREAEALAQSTQRFLGALSEVQDFSNLESGEAELAVEVSTCMSWSRRPRPCFKSGPARKA